jgi:hypothetical protein|tara:strand:- start:3376 stop:3930 length:555 start_codon:yes stop_codon:yes gene_type:complete
MPLPHYTQSRASSQRFEPIQPNLFELTVFSPLGDDTGLILEQVKSIGGLNALNPSIDPIAQKYKFADRSFAGMPAQTFVDLPVNFTLNLNDANENYIYNTFRNWTNLIYDPLTGEMGLKKDYVGSMILVQYNRAGDIFRKITFKDVFPIQQMDFVDELAYENQDAVELTITYRCDHWVEENVGA